MGRPLHVSPTQEEELRQKRLRPHLVTSTIIGGLASLSAGAALAQTAPAPASNPGANAAVQEVVITGSRIRQPNLTTASPVTSVSNQEIRLEGAQRVEDLLNNLPQVFADQGLGQANGADGTATVNLRGLGANRTLVLIDGIRAAPGSPGGNSADLNLIPAALVDRIDVVTGGASAIYGADAISGVVNFIMKKNFEGIQIDVNNSFIDHDNGDGAVQGVLAGRAATNPAQFHVPESNFVGGRSTNVTITMGTNSADGKGNITAYLGFQHTAAVDQSHFDYSECALNTGAVYTCGGSNTANPPRFNGTLTLDPAHPGDLTAYDPATGQFNYAPYNYYQRPDERYTAGFFGHYQVNKAFDVYAQFMFLQDHSTAAIAPGGVFVGTGPGPAGSFQVNCDNPLLSNDGPNSEVAQFCGGAATPGRVANLNIGKRNQEGGARTSTFDHTEFRSVIGVKGEIAPGWNYDVYGAFSETRADTTVGGYFSVAKITNALQVVNVNGVATCTSVVNGTDPACVPYNIFTPGGVTQAALNYLSVSAYTQSYDTQQDVVGSVTGSLGQYGVQSPWAKDGLSLVVGGEYRRDYYQFSPDTETQGFDLSGGGGSSPPSAGAVSSKEVFTELRVPLISDRPFVKDLSFDLGYRRSDNSLSGTNDTYKIEGNWTPIRDVRFRGSFNRAVRDPTVGELFAPTSINLDGGQDPCAGPAALDKNGVLRTALGATQAQCALEGVTAAQFGTVDSAQQYNGQLGGNTKLKPEVGDTYTAGILLTPRFLPGFSLSVDYYDIRINGIIGTIGEDLILQQCIATASPTYCGLIHRDSAGSLLSNTGFVQDTLLNLGYQEEKGIDFQANYRLPLSRFGLKDMGRVDFNLVGTYIDSFFTQPLPGGVRLGETECVGAFGPECGTPNPVWRHKLRATWTTPWRAQLSVQWRYIDGVHLYTPEPGAFDNTIPSYNYIDLAATWNVRDNIEFRVGVNNVFDKDPPLVGAQNAGTSGGVGPYNGNTYNNYDVMGRYIFTGITVKY